MDDELRAIFLEGHADDLEIGKIKQAIANATRRSQGGRHGVPPNAGEGRPVAVPEDADHLPFWSVTQRGLHQVISDESAGTGDPSCLHELENRKQKRRIKSKVAVIRTDSIQTFWVFPNRDWFGAVAPHPGVEPVHKLYPSISRLVNPS